MRSRGRLRLLALAALALAAVDPPARACGPYFPFWWLGEPETALSGPVPGFAAEVARLDLPPARFPAVVPEGHPWDRPDPRQRTAQADLATLRRALTAAGRGDAEIDAVAQGVAAFRDALRGGGATASGEPWPTAAPPPPLPESLPEEFVLYLRGAAAYHGNRPAEAAAAWRRLLALPEAERPHRSLWAAYMLGRLAVADRPWEAGERFAEVRRLAASGHPDPLGLAAESVGWEARAALDAGDLPTALRLYAEQHRAGDPSALVSLHQTALRAAWGDAATQAAVAADPVGREVVTAALLALPGPPPERVQAWVAALQASGAEAPQGDRLAWLAYNAGAFGLAEELVSHPDGPAGRWVQAKLLLRAGRLEEGRRTLEAAAAELPPRSPEELGEPWLVVHDVIAAPRPDRQRGLAEVGVVAAAAGDYGAALEALLAAGEWQDAAWLAERVLTADELLAWMAEGREVPPELRHLAARRLAREGRYREAVELFPAELRPGASAFAGALERAGAQGGEPGARAGALWEAARIARWQGLELLATELEPDWYLMGAQFTPWPIETRRQGAAGGALAPTADELRRAAATRLDPGRRFHYRYRAADLAWQAASLLPDGDPQAAEILCRAGTWLAFRDPPAADRFYKALVGRGGATPLARDADARRWFPPGCGGGPG